MRLRERQLSPASDVLAKTVARNFAKLLPYKDEYEVARLSTSKALKTEMAATFADGGRWR